MGKKDDLIEKNYIVFEEKKLSICGKDIVINNYIILGIINNGANAVILKAKGTIANEIVAIKIWIPSDKSNSEEQSKNEITKMAEINSIEYTPNLIRYYGSGTINGYFYCIMEFLDDSCYVTLREKLEGYMTLNERYHILMDIISGLRHTQEKQIFHGDLHADNILINKLNSTAKIIDFGTSFRNREYSKRRDNKMTLEIARSLLSEDLDDGLIIYYDVEPEMLPQNAVRLIIKATAKIVVLLDFWKVGNVEAVIEDIALFATLVPFFNLKLLVNILFASREVPERFKELFKEKIIIELFQDTSDKDFDELEEMYIEKQKRFIKFCESEPHEKNIYRNVRQASLFNGPLFAKRNVENNAIFERHEIEQIIE